MKTTVESAYRTMMSAAATLGQRPEGTTERQLSELAMELATAVRDLDAGMRAGLTPPQAWQTIHNPADATHGRTSAS